MNTNRSQTSSSLLSDLSAISFCLRLLKVRRLLIGVAVLFSVLPAILNLAAVGLLFRILQGIITRDFTSAVRVQPFIWLQNHNLFPRDSGAVAFSLLLFTLYFVTLLRNGIALWSAYFLRRETTEATLRMRVLLFDRFLSFGKQFFDINHSSRLILQFVNCTGWMQNLLVALQKWLSEWLKLVIYAGVMAYLSWRLTVAACLVAPFLSLFSRALARKVRGLSAEYQSSVGGLSAALAHILRNVPTIRLADKTDAERSRFIETSSQELEIARRVQDVKSLITPLQDFFGLSAQLILGICFAWFEDPQSLQPHQILLFFFLTSRIIPVFNSINLFRANLAEQSGPMNLFFSLLSEDGKFKVASGSGKFPSGFSELTLKDITFGYEPERPILKDLSFSIRGGERVAIVGPSGAGKTTLLHLIMRLYEYQTGTMECDGSDIRTFDLSTFHSAIAYVSQEAVLLDDSIRANLCYARPDAVSEAEMDAVIEAVGLTDLVNSLPQKVDTQVGEAGALLSGGERQRITIARALLKRSSIIIFDEPLSALDAETEGHILSSVTRYLEGRAVIFVTHRLSLAKLAERVVVLEDGRISQAGPVQDLIAREGYFRAAWAAQRS